ncbi:heat shock protein Hsp90 [Gammaproteobacteria bacterium]|nr:heat shock protein Hsp90 [Gammaproteobacteria bacterium]
MSNNVETMQFQTEVNQLLKLMIHSLYSNREIFLRELISNSSDALDKRRFAGLTNEKIIENQGLAQIDITFNKDAKTITIADNGIGMTKDEVIDNIGTIAKSGTKAFLEKLEADQKSASQMIGQFGVGFYSAFIVAQEIELCTRKAGENADTATTWRSKGEAEFSLETSVKESVGTSIILHIRDEHLDLLSDWTLKNIIQKYSDHIAFPVFMTTEKEVPDEDNAEDADNIESTESTEGTESKVKATKLETNVEQINQATSLWQRAKKDISDDEYTEFYKHVAHDYQAPLTWAHNQVEGKVSYTSLLYIPSVAPAGMWEQNATHGVQLYVQRVFIMDGADKLMPRYLRFVKGVIDAADLPLNVSREILQSSSTVDSIRQGATKRILTTLESLSQTDVEKYKIFWAQFGRMLKEGMGEDFANRENLSNLLRFSSTSDDTQSVSLKDYVARMGDAQDKIYYLTSDNLNTAKNSPHLEIFKQKGIEVLLMTESVDDWMMGFMYEYEGKSFVHIAKGDINLDAADDSANPDAKKDEPENSDHDKALIEKIKLALGDKVESVKISKRLTDSASCLVRSQQSLSAHFEKMLKDAGHEVPTSKPWLEINPKHPLLIKIAATDDAADLAVLAYEQAILLEGSQLEDPAGFVARLNRLMS